MAGPWGGPWEASAVRAMPGGLCQRCCHLAGSFWLSLLLRSRDHGCPAVGVEADQMSSPGHGALAGRTAQPRPLLTQAWNI